MDLRPVKSKTSLSELASLVSGTCHMEATVTGITHNSRSVRPGDLFVALPGSNVHGIEYVDQALSNGAIAVATDSTGYKSLDSKKVPCLELTDARKDMAKLAAQIYGHPENSLKIVGVTGTNGKTTTTHMLRSIFLDSGSHVGVIGTLGTFLDLETIPSARTTPESTDLFALLAVMVEQGITHVFMEVSSHALELDRVLGLQFDVAIFTNLTQDHLDFHGSMERYFAAKAKLFTPSYAKAAVICIDDDWGKKLFAQVTIPAISIGSQGDWQTQLATSNSTGFTTQELQRADGTNFSIEVNMLGAYNAVNASCALAASEILGLPLQQGIKSIRNIRAIPGRLEEVIVSGLARVIVDYAHTPDAVATALNAIRESGVGKLITVIGCGGDRDSSKRPIMGRVASQLSDVVIITDDNPRSEEPAEIRRQILAGIASDATQVFEVANRREAIARALNIAQRDDVVAILGKGHETGQEINGEIFPFDDRLVAVQESELA